MKTITVKNIDGLNIITNIGNVNGLIDPEATKKIVKVEITKTDIHKEIQKIKKQMSVYARQAHEAMKHAKKSSTEADKNKFVTESNARRLQFNEEMEKMKPLAVQLNKEYKTMMVEKAVYFTPTQGEEILPDEEVDDIEQKMIAATQAGKLLDRDKNEVDNYVGKSFWKEVSGRWERTDFNIIGVAPVAGSSEISDLTEEQVSEILEQLEMDRIDGLSSVNKDVEKNNILALLLTQSAMKKTELDILGDKDALTKAQAWLADETVKVELKYA